jgi:L,D-transpeptidase catalytic domain
MHLRFAAALAALFATLAFTPARADLLIQVDKSAQQMTVSEDGNLLYTWPVSTGRAGYNTPNGAFNPIWMDRDHHSEEWDDAPMPYSIFFTKQGHAIHGTYEASHLGHAVSHGCVRLSVKHAALLWDLVKKNKMGNTTVALTGEIPGGAGMVVAHAAPRQPQAADDQDDDEVTAVPPRRTFGRNGWFGGEAPRAYYDREQPYYARPRGFFPFGW